ncbi:MAG TPA: hypothetical protein VFA28_00030 [Bryobacteraceae bacterium]|nr:hypothetical protein [Bryobacteraceae bacterium]
MAPSRPAAASADVEAFKLRTRDKLRNVRCPLHNETPRLKFEGASLRDVTLSISSCCDQLSRLANIAIAS